MMIKNVTSTKEKLLIILKKSHETTIKDIMEHFKVSEIAIRRHLQNLIREGLVKEQSVKQRIGRPYKVYCLTTKGHEVFPNQYKELPVQFLSDLEDLHGEEAVHDLLKKRKMREEKQFLSKIKSNDFDGRMKEMVNLQSEKGYMIDLKKVENGYELINYNCPIYNIATSYIQVCSNEKETLKKVFPNSKVTAHSQISAGDCCCKWTVHRPISE